MALRPSLRPLIIAGAHDAPHTLDIFLDFVCPYSGKVAITIDKTLEPLVSPGGKYAGKVKLIFRLHPQPWHGSSTFTHEAALAVLRVAPELFWAFSKLLFENQDAFFDIPTANLSPIQIRAELATLASQILSKDQVEAFKDLLVNKGSPNGGVAITEDLKYNIRFSRQNSIHVSPTVAWDGVVAPDMSSSWGEKEWSEFLEAKVAI